MANIRENKRNGKIISFRFTACLERDAEGKQVRPHTVLEDFPLFCPKCKRESIINAQKFNVETSSSVKKSDFLKSLKEGIDGIVVEVSETGKSLRLTKKGVFICSVTKE